MNIYKTIEIKGSKYQVGFDEVDLDKYVGYVRDANGNIIIKTSISGTLQQEIKSGTGKYHKDVLVEMFQGIIEKLAADD